MSKIKQKHEFIVLFCVVLLKMEENPGKPVTIEHKRKEKYTIILSQSIKCGCFLFTHKTRNYVCIKIRRWT